MALISEVSRVFGVLFPLGGGAGGPKAPPLLGSRIMKAMEEVPTSRMKPPSAGTERDELMKRWAQLCRKMVEVHLMAEFAAGWAEGFGKPLDWKEWGKLTTAEHPNSSQMREIRRLLQIESTELEKKKKKLRRALAKRALPIESIVERAVEVMGNRDDAMRWLGTPVRALDFATPVSMLATSAGLDKVLDVLGQMEHGVW